MTKTLYIVAQVLHEGATRALVIKTGAANNLLSVLNIPGIISANVCDTKKQAYEIADNWNEAAKQNGTYLAYSPPSAK